MKRHRKRLPREAGFTILEVLIATAIIGLMAVVAIEAMQAYGPRVQLQQMTGRAAQLINKARLEAIRRGVTSVVAADFDERTLTAFAEVNGDPDDPLNPAGKYLIYDPEPLLPRDRTDYLIGVVDLPGKLETGVRYGGPDDGFDGDDSVEGFTDLPEGGTTPDTVLVFRSTGAILDPGAFRFADARGENHLEVSLTAITGKIAIRKYLKAEDSPTGEAGYFAEANKTFGNQGTGQAVGDHVWVWY